MINENWILVGIILQFLGSWGYIYDTIKGKVVPNKVSWLLWSIAPLVAFFAMIKQGVGLQAWVTFSVGFVPIIVFIASFFNKKANWQITKIDLICGTLSLIGLILWMVTKVGNIAIVFSLLADGLAEIPTVIKSYKEPETENAGIFVVGSINSLIGILTITNWNFETYAFPIYLLVINSLIAILIKGKFNKLEVR